VLLLPGLLCTDLIFRDMLEDPAMARAGIRMLAGNPPGFKGQPVPPDFGFQVESYAALVEEICASEKVDVLVGHSYFGNVAIEVGARGKYRNGIMLISPSLFRMAEPNDTRTLDSMSRKPVLSGLTWWATWLMLKSIFKPYFTTEAAGRLDDVVADAKRTPRPIARRLLLSLFDYIDRHGDLTKRVLAAPGAVWYVRGQQDNIGFTDEQRRTLEGGDRVKVVDIEGSRHFAMLDKPLEVNRLIREMLNPSTSSFGGQP
jgi:pimeloyl-ACP methyl ester carboxylesterase